jgi:hypothetical protein
MGSRCLVRIIVVLLSTIGSLHTHQVALAQFTLSAESGVWAPLFPDYEAASIVAPGGGSILTPNLFDDEQSGIGPYAGLNARYDLAGSESYLEVNAYVANADSIGSDLAVNDPGPAGTVWMPALSGSDFLSTANGESVDFSLDSEVFHHAEYVGFRRTFPESDNMFSLGAGYRHLAFDQGFTFDGLYSDDFLGRYQEDLESDFDGIQFVAGCQRRVNGNPCLFDFGFGVYRLDANYEGQTFFFDPGDSLIFDDQVSREIGDTAVTFDLTLKTERQVGDYLVRPMFVYTFLSDMPYIVHPQTETSFGPPVDLATRSASMIRGGLEVVF